MLFIFFLNQFFFVKSKGKYVAIEAYDDKTLKIVSNGTTVSLQSVPTPALPSDPGMISLIEYRENVFEIGIGGGYLCANKNIRKFKLPVDICKFPTNNQSLWSLIPYNESYQLKIYNTNSCLFRDFGLLNERISGEYALRLGPCNESDASRFNIVDLKLIPNFAENDPIVDANLRKLLPPIDNVKNPILSDSLLNKMPTADPPKNTITGPLRYDPFNKEQNPLPFLRELDKLQEIKRNEFKNKEKTATNMANSVLERF